MSGTKSAFSPLCAISFSKKACQSSGKLPRLRQLSNSQLWAHHLCLCGPGRVLASHSEGKQEETISDSLRQVEEQSSGFGLIMELTRGKFLLPKDTLYWWSAPLFLAKKMNISPWCSIDLSVYEWSLLLVLAWLREPSFRPDWNATAINQIRKRVSHQRAITPKYRAFVIGLSCDSDWWLRKGSLHFHLLLNYKFSWETSKICLFQPLELESFCFLQDRISYKSKIFEILVNLDTKLIKKDQHGNKI